MRRCFIIMCFMIIFFPTAARGDEVVYEQLDTLGLEAVEEETFDGTSLSEIVRDIISGEFSLSNLPKALSDMALYELKAQGILLTQLILVVILSGILKQASGSLKGRTAGETGFYVCYMVLIIIVLNTFYSISAGVAERVEQTGNAFLGMLPVYLVLSATGGNITQTALIGPTIMGGSALLTFGVKTVIVPAILLAVTLEMVDNISEKPVLSRFAKLFRQCIQWILKGSAVIFMFLISLEKIGGGALNGLGAKTARIAVGAIPVVGDVMGGTVETAAAVAGTLKSASLAGGATFLVLLCLPILIKLIIVMLVFKVTAAAAEFICEERLVECISAAGDYTGLLVGVVFLAEAMFLFSAILLLGSF